MAKPTRDWTSIVIQFVPAILGSGVLITTFTGYYNDLATQPNVRFTLFPDTNNYSKFSALIENTGGGPANNFTGLIITPYSIADLRSMSLASNDISTQGSNAVKISIPKFIQGEGSIVNISLIMRNSTTYSDDYEAYAIFDEGSVIGHFYEPANIFTDFVEWIITPVGFAILGITITILGLGIRYGYLRYRKFRYSRIYKTEVNNYSSNLDESLSWYKKNKLSGQSWGNIASGLVGLEELNIAFNKFLEWTSRVDPDLGKDMTIAKKHDDYFKFILDDATRNLTTNQERNDFFDRLDTEIVLQSGHRSTSAVTGLVTRLGVYRKAMMET
jgi:hypothetical protein